MSLDFLYIAPTLIYEFALRALGKIQSSGGAMRKNLILAFLTLVSVSAFAASPFDRKTQECILTQLVYQYSQLDGRELTVGLVDGDEDAFELQIVQKFDDGGTGNLFVGAKNRNYSNGYLKVPGLARDLPLDIAMWNKVCYPSS